MTAIIADNRNLLPLTSLRFFAAMMIVAHHLPLYFPETYAKAAPPTLVHGVSFFFVLSGFILTHAYKEKPWPGYWQFLALRAGRLWPVHAFAIMILVLSVLVPDSFVRHDSITFDGPGFFDRWFALGLNLTMLQSWSPYTVQAFSWNSPAWSISTEFAFYLAFPFLLVNVERNWHWKLLGAALIVGWFLAIASGLPVVSATDAVDKASLTYANPLFRGFEFCLGMATWVLWDRHIRRLRLTFLIWSAIEVAAISLVAFWLLKRFGRFHTVALLQPWTGVAASCFILAVFIAILATGQGIIGRALSNAPLVFLGEISYSVYILHMVLLKIFFAHGLLPMGEWLFLGALLIVSALSYLLIEKPARGLVAQAVRNNTIHFRKATDASPLEGIGQVVAENRA